MKYLLKYNENLINNLKMEADALASFLDNCSDFEKFKSDYPNTIYLYELSISENIKFQVHCSHTNDFIVVQLYIFDKKNFHRYYVDSYTIPEKFKKIIKHNSSTSVESLKLVANISSFLFLKQEEFLDEDEIINTVITELTDIGFSLESIKFSFFEINSDVINYYRYQYNRYQQGRFGYIIQLIIPSKYDDLDYSEIKIKDSLNHMSGILDYYGDYKLSHHYIDNNLYLFIEK